MPLKGTLAVLEENLRTHMRHQGLNGPALAKAAKVDPKTINNILNARNYPQLDKLEAIAKALGLQPWQLLVHEMAAAIIAGGDLASLIEAWANTDDAGRETIRRIVLMVPRKVD